MVPPDRPKLSREEVVAILKAHGITDEWGLVGIRGYYKRTMGDPARNDRNIYDDAVFFMAPGGVFVPFNANCDPSRYQPGIATLKPGLWYFEIGIHGITKTKSKRYKALVQAVPFTVIRDGGLEETGWWGLNMHKGGEKTTGSLGCQTIVPKQWDGFIGLVEGEMMRRARKRIPYVLVENK